jgi:hypothetical protein
MIGRDMYEGGSEKVRLVGSVVRAGFVLYGGAPRQEGP